MELTPDEVVDRRFRITRKLSDGGMGSVYRAVDVELEREVALKVLRGDYAVKGRETLRHEAVALAKLRHENVVGVHAFGEHEGRPYFVMEFVAGRNLALLVHEHLMRRQHVPYHRGIQILRDVCDGLAAIHGAGLIHRDLKLSNVVVEDRTGRIVIVDFGAAIVRAEWDRRVVGTPAYIAPELLVGASPSPRSDLYSLGCTAFELLTGRLPFVGENREDLQRLHAEAPIPVPSSLRDELSPVDALIGELLAKVPWDRLPSAALVSNRFADALAQGPSVPEPPTEMSASTEVAVETGGINILVVDDDPLFARIAARCAQVALSDERVVVSRAATGARALEKAARRRPDLVVLDYLLPDMNGVEVLSRLRAMREGFHCEVVVASGTLEENEQWRFGILGVRDFISKPVEFSTLVERLHDVARRRAWTPTEDEPVAAQT